MQSSGNQTGLGLKTKKKMILSKRKTKTNKIMHKMSKSK